MKNTIYHAQYRTLNLIHAIENEPNQHGLDNLKSCLQQLHHTFLYKIDCESLELSIAQGYRQMAINLYRQCELLLKAQHRSQLKSICMALVCLAQKIESLSEPAYINIFKQKIDPLLHNSSQFGTTIIRPLCQQASVYLAGHKGICAKASQEWLADNIIAEPNLPHAYSVDELARFVKKVTFHKEELCFLYALEKKNIKNTLTFFPVTGLLRLSHGAMLLALLDELSEQKNTRFFITFAHFRNRLFHSVGCKFNQDLIQWFDSDCGIFQNHHKENFGRWLDFYLTQNNYKDKFSFFTIQIAEHKPKITDKLSNGIKYTQHLF